MGSQKVEERWHDWHDWHDPYPVLQAIEFFISTSLLEIVGEIMHPSIIQGLELNLLLWQGASPHFQACCVQQRSCLLGISWHWQATSARI